MNNKIEYGGSLFRTEREMKLAMAADWLSGGAYRRPSDVDTRPLKQGEIADFIEWSGLGWSSEEAQDILELVQRESSENTCPLTGKIHPRE